MESVDVAPSRIWLCKYTESITILTLSTLTSPSTQGSINSVDRHGVPGHTLVRKRQGRRAGLRGGQDRRGFDGVRPGITAAAAAAALGRRLRQRRGGAPPGLHGARLPVDQSRAGNMVVGARSVNHKIHHELGSDHSTDSWVSL